MLLEWRIYDSPYSIIDPRVTNASPLDSLMASRFLPNTTLYDIVSQLFIENWTSSTDFISYYNRCAPDECTYTFEERFNIVYIISTTLGIVGGLSVALQILTPLIAKLLRRMFNQCHSQQTLVAREAFAVTGKNQYYMNGEY